MAPFLLCALAVLLLPSFSVANTVAAGAQHSVVIGPGGIVWTWGGNGNGQLGDGTVQNRSTPAPVGGLPPIIAVAAGQSHTLALAQDGSVWAWGNNANGELGDDSQTQRLNPVQLLGISDVIAIAAGDHHSVALTSDGSVWTWGYNNFGQLGDGGVVSFADQPLKLSIPGASALAAGGSHTLALLNDGTVLAWGYNNYGQLGDGTSGTSRESPVQMAGVTGAAAVAAGTSHSLVLLNDGTVRAVGYDSFGQLGDGSPHASVNSVVTVLSITGAVDIAATANSSYARTSSGVLWAWGNGGSGQLGDNASGNRNTPYQISSLPAVIQMEAGDAHAIAVSADGVVWTWGSNSVGQLGDGTANIRRLPGVISAASYVWNVGTPVFSLQEGTYTTEKSVTVSCATPDAVIHYTLDGTTPTEADQTVTSGGTVLIDQTRTLTARAWKAGFTPSNIQSSVYVLTVATPTFSPATGTYTMPQTVTIATGSPAASIRYTLDNTTPTETSSLYTQPLSVSTLTTVKAVGFRANWTTSNTATANYTFNYGTLAQPTASPGAGTYETQVTVTLAAAPEVTIRYTTSGSDPTASSTVYTGPLTFTTTTTLKAKAFRTDYPSSPTFTQAYTIKVPTPVLSALSGTYTPGESVTITDVDSAATIRITLTAIDPVSADPAVASGTFLLVGNFTLKARAFRSGCTDSDVASATYVLTERLGTGALAAGQSHNVLATPDGLVYAWGLNTSSQLGIGNSTNRASPTLVQTLTGVTSASAGQFHTLAVTWDRRVFAWGANGSGRLGDGSTTTRSSPVPVSSLSNVISVAAGGSHSLALTADGLVYAWGAGGSGQLGLGSPAPSSMLTPALIPSLSNVVAIAAGGSHSLAVTATGQLYAWGANNSYQLGDGTVTTRHSPTLITTLANVATVSAGSSFSLATLQNGAAYAWGAGGSGQLGLGTVSNRSTPTPVPGMSAALLTAGSTHAAAVRTDGVLVAWGGNTSGQVGDTTTNSPQSSPVPVVGPTAVALVSVGTYHSVALTPEGHVWTWGQGSAGQLGDGTTTSIQPIPHDVWTAPGLWITVADPVLDLAGGTYNAPQTVTVTDATPDAVMHYTTSGALPTEADAIVPADGRIDISGTMTVRVRAWGTGMLPSNVVTATYTLQPVSPTITPGAGTYGAAQNVALTTVTSGAAIRFTTDGSDPTATSPLYTGTFAVATTTTIKAAAFLSGWTRSAVASASLAFNYGTLTAPIATPGSGAYSYAQQVVLSSPEGGGIVYTLDGSDPTSSSTAYSAPIALAVGGTTLKARAYKADWTASVVAHWDYTIDTDVTPPTITAQISPLPNAAGWNNSTVTITYTCADLESGVATCPGPAIVDSDGAGITIARDAVDRSGNRTTSSVVVNLDRDAPILTQYAPPDGDVLPLDIPSFEVRGSALDATSAISWVTCNDAPAVIEGQRYSCISPAANGANAVHIVATDAAGNTSAIDLTVTVDNPPPPTSLEITPRKMTLLPGESHEIRVTDQRGRAVTSGTFTVQDELVAAVEVDANNVPFVRGVAGGETTVTLNRDGLVAEATVTVLPELTTSYPAGTTLWSLGNSSDGIPAHGTIVRAPASSALDDVKRADLYFIDEGTEWVDGQLVRMPNKRAIIRAATLDGQQLWMSSFSDIILTQAAADNTGGLLLVSDAQYDAQDNYHPARIRRLDGATGAVTWEYNVIGSVTKVAVHPDSRVFTGEYPYYGTEAYLTAINDDGAVQKWALPKGHAVRYVDGVADINGDSQPEPSAPLLQEDGSVVMVSNTYRSVGYFLEDDYPVNHLIPDPSHTADNSYRSYITVTTLDPGESQPVFHDVDITAAAVTSYPDWSEDLYVPLSSLENTLLPDGNGGLLLGADSSPSVNRIYQDTQQNYVMAPSQRLVPWGGTFHMEYVLAEEGVHALALGTTTEYPDSSYWAHYMIFDPQTLALIDDGPIGGATQTPKQVQLQMAVAGGGSYISGPTDSYLVNTVLSPASFVNGGLATEVFPGFINQWSADGGALVVGFQSTRGVTAFPYRNGNTAGARAPHAPTFVHFVVPDLLKSTPPWYTAYDYRTEIVKSDEHRTLANNARNRFHLISDATLRSFETVLSQTADAVVFIGDSIIPPDTVAEHAWGSIGLKFSDKGLIKRSGVNEPQFCDPRDVDNVTHACVEPGAYQYTKLVDKMATNAKVVLIASCKIGDKFKGLWDINELTTSRSLVVPSIVQNTDLLQSAGMFIHILESLVGGTAKNPTTVSAAVAAANAWGTGAHYSVQFTSIGGANVSVK